MRCIACPSAALLALALRLVAPAAAAPSAALQGACATAEDVAANLLQVKADKVATAREAAISWRCVEADYPDVGPVFTLAYAERIRETGAFEGAIGCEDPHPEDWDKPLGEVIKRGQDGFCHFNFFSQCTAAVRAKDYAAYALAFSKSAVTQFVKDDPNNVHCPTGYEAGDYKTAPGVFAYDGKLCFDNGFLDLPKGAYLNFTLLAGLAGDYCEKLYKLHIPDYPSWTYPKNGFSTTLQEDYVMEKEAHMPSASRELGSPTKHDLLRHELGKCALWDPHGLACDMAYCQYNFCKLPDGRVGQGLQCHKDWLNPKFVAAHIDNLRTPPL